MIDRSLEPDCENRSRKIAEAIVGIPDHRANACDIGSPELGDDEAERVAVPSELVLTFNP